MRQRPRNGPSVLLCTEGSYPFVGGGVSTWCDILCHGLPEYEFVLLAVMGGPEGRTRFDLPPNARTIIRLPLWGLEEPAEHQLAHLPAAEIRARRRGTTPAVVEEEFVPLLRRLLRAFMGSQLSERVETDGGALVSELWRYFQRRDWRRTWRSMAAWHAFSEEVLSAHRRHREKRLDPPSIAELATALRWLYAFLGPLSAPIPETDLVHTTLAGFPGLVGVIAKHERGTPLLVTEHGVWIRERYISISASEMSSFEKHFLMDLSRYVTQLNYSCADVIAPVTNFNRRWELPSGVDPLRIETIVNGVDPGTFVPRPKPERTRRRPVVICAARVYPLKDLETMIRAAPLVREELPSVEFRVYGSLDADVEYTARCRSLIAELGLEKTYELAGHHSSPAELFSEGDVSALSSISEAFPYTVLESMACARPVVATDVGGVREVLEGFGIIVPPRNHEAFAAGLLRLLTDHALRAQLGRQAREAVLARYRVQGTVGGYRELYARLLATRASHRRTGGPATGDGVAAAA